MIKHYKKISNVCQLLDKSLYPATQTKNGITFTNNGDGTITANGTSTARIDFPIKNVKRIKGHKYLLKGCPSGGSSTTFRLVWYIGSLYITDYGDGGIGEATNSDITNLGVTIVVHKEGITMNNLTFTPQLFDLTKMYGEGNEPTTVAEFKTKFPLNYYNYSPRCWVSYYKKLHIQNTKNLYNGLNEITSVTNATFNSGFSSSINSNLDFGTYNICIYTINQDRDWAFRLYNYTKGKYIFFYVTFLGITSKTFTLTNENYSIGDDLRVFIWNTENIKHTITFKNIQIELGSQATSFVPYGYIPTMKTMYKIPDRFID